MMLGAAQLPLLLVATFYFAPSALSKNQGLSPRALPWAFTFRAFGAETFNLVVPRSRF